VRTGLNRLIDETAADELMIVSDIYDHALRLRSFEIIANTQRADAQRQLCPEI
ncbi:MAG TPA: alkane 1-monooxygenase, partial [Hyphomicrobium sp.]|nr:alkane 1-monooxygenase [Hyphomicrobium sp.]